MTISYSTNWMGPISMDWYRERGLTKMVEHNTDTIEEITTYYAAGRIDIRDDSKEGYDGWDEYGVAPMHGEDWNALSDYLDDLTTEELLPYNTLVAQFEAHYGKKIRWADE